MKRNARQRMLALNPPPKSITWDSVKAFKAWVDEAYDDILYGFGDGLEAFREELRAERRDLLGAAFMALKANDAKGKAQVFTPTFLARDMAKVALEAMLAKPPANRAGHYMAYDPACGAGAFAIAMDCVAGEMSLEHLPIYYVLNDLDPFCCRMAFLQCALLDLPALIACSDFLDGRHAEKWQITPGFPWALVEDTLAAMKPPTPISQPRRGARRKHAETTEATTPGESESSA